MKLIIDIPEEDYVLANRNDYSKIYGGTDTHIAEAIKNGIMISESPTNGDIIKAMFPNDRFELSSGFYESKREHGMRCTYDWWNALWKKDKENNYADSN